MKKYYFHNGNDQEGPFDINDLKEKNITTDTPIWFEGSSEWTTAGKVEELLPLLKPLTPPPFQPFASIPVRQTEQKPKIEKPTSIATEQKKNGNRWKIIIVVVLVLAAILATVVKNNPNSIPEVKIQVNAPKPVVINQRYEDASAFFKAKVKVFGTIQNQGGDGNVFVTFTITQNGNTYDKSKSLFLAAGEAKEVDEMFREIKRLDGEFTFKVNARSE